MAYIPTSSVSFALITYLHKYVKEASGGRVTLINSTGVTLGSGGGYFVFKCSACKDNWHVGFDNFEGPTALPSVLEDWVKKHRHVCTKYNPNTNTHVTCMTCGWPYGAHEESWAYPEGTVQNWGSTSFLAPKPIKVWSGTNVPFDQPAPKGHPAYKHLEKPVPTYRGRKFRDSADE